MMANILLNIYFPYRYGAGGNDFSIFDIKGLEDKDNPEEKITTIRVSAR
jgi:hypothetical protein